MTGMLLLAGHTGFVLRIGAGAREADLHQGPGGQRHLRHHVLPARQKGLGGHVSSLVLRLTCLKRAATEEAASSRVDSDGGNASVISKRACVFTQSCRASSVPHTATTRRLARALARRLCSEPRSRSQPAGQHASFRRTHFTTRF